jgi:hypothetical protein
MREGLFRLLGLGSLALILALSAPAQAVPAVQSSVCDYYVDNEVSGDGDGSWTYPWNEIGEHIGDLVPGDTMCVRGDLAGSGREYRVNAIRLDRIGGQVRDGVPGNPIVVRAYPGEKVILRNVGSDSLLYFRGADYWVFEGFAMDNNGRGKWTVDFKDGASHNILRSNEIHNGGVTGIALRSGGNVGNVIEGNHIHHFDRGDADAHGIILYPGSNDTIIRGNVIHDCSGDGIHIYALDHTPVSEYSKGVQVVDNLFYRGTLSRSEDGIDIKGADGLVVTGNELHGYHYDRDTGVVGVAIVVHKGSRNISIRRNVVHDTSAGIRCFEGGGKRPENITIKNNLFHNIDVDDRYAAIVLADVYGAIVYHNTIVNATGASFRIWGGGLRGGDIRNNLIYDSAEAKIGDGAAFTGVTVGYNGWFDAGAEDRFTAPTDVVGSGDPGFVDVADGDLHLVASSLARDAGRHVGVIRDFEGDPRPYGDRPDLGADEYLPTPYLRAMPRDGVIHLTWTQLEDPALASYAITYTYGVVGSPANQGPSPILGISPAGRTYSLTGVTNYVFYTMTVAARDGGDADLAVSNSVRVMPTDIFVYLPSIMQKEGP